MIDTKIIEMFKIGIGPSSSHTLGPWHAARHFYQKIKEYIYSNERQNKQLQSQLQLNIHLYGSLCLTGIGHGTDKAVCWGILNLNPETVALKSLEPILTKLKHESKFLIGDAENNIFVQFNPLNDIIYHEQPLPHHNNGLKFELFENSNSQKIMLLEETYYSIGGGFIEIETILKQQQNSIQREQNDEKNIPHTFFRFKNAQELYDISQQNYQHALSLADITLNNEMVLNQYETVSLANDSILKIWSTMYQTLQSGFTTQQKVLSGGLNVQRRAGAIAKKLYEQYSNHHSDGDNKVEFSNIQDWLPNINKDFATISQAVSMLALATNEENADFGRIVTAPTNGSAGVIPATLGYVLWLVDSKITPLKYQKENKEDQEDKLVIEFLATASIIGALFRHNATISAAMGGCQAEIGVSSAMAAAGLTACLGGTVCQVMTAAEIAMEHHLGLTCDPIKGLVQIPCIERNSMGAIKAINAAYLALNTNSDLTKVSLDDVITTMWKTAQDMPMQYKETALGGLAIHVREVVC